MRETKLTKTIELFIAKLNWPPVHACSAGSVVSDSVTPWSTRVLFLWASPGKNTGGELPCLPLGDLPNPGIEPASLTSTCIGIIRN